MNDVIDKLADIEAAAVRITENVSAQKAKIAKDSEQKIREYDKNFQRRLDERIEELKADNDREVQSEIKRMQQDSIRAIEKLEEKYEEGHEIMAHNIVNLLTGV